MEKGTDYAKNEIARLQRILEKVTLMGLFLSVEACLVI